MYKKTIKYTDYNGMEREEDFYFNLTKAEIAEMNFEYDGNITGYLEQIKSAVKVKEVAEIFKKIILMSYGERSIDGKRFIKERDGKRLADAFKETEAYSELYIELLTSEKAASDFINGINPTGAAPAVGRTDFAKNVA